MYYVGNLLFCISFTSMALPDGRIVVHSALHAPNEEVEDFLYEIVDRHVALETARSMVEDAYAYLSEQGCSMDGNLSTDNFVGKLKAELKNALH
jgi:hypothetical protein